MGDEVGDSSVFTVEGDTYIVAGPAEVVGLVDVVVFGGLDVVGKVVGGWFDAGLVVVDMLVIVDVDREVEVLVLLPCGDCIDDRTTVGTAERRVMPPTWLSWSVHGAVNVLYVHMLTTVVAAARRAWGNGVVAQSDDRGLGCDDARPKTRHLTSTTRSGPRAGQPGRRPGGGRRGRRSGPFWQVES